MLFIFYILQSTVYSSTEIATRAVNQVACRSTGQLVRIGSLGEDTQANTPVCPYDDGVSPQPLPAQVFHCHSEGVQVDAAHHRSPEPDALEPCQHQLSHSAAAAACDCRRFF